MAGTLRSDTHAALAPDGDKATARWRRRDIVKSRFPVAEAPGEHPRETVHRDAHVVPTATPFADPTLDHGMVGDVAHIHTIPRELSVCKGDRNTPESNTPKALAMNRDDTTARWWRRGIMNVRFPVAKPLEDRPTLVPSM